MDIKFNTIAEVKTKAAEIEMRAINFLKKDGSYAQGDVREIDRVQMVFIDGTEMVLTWADASSPAFDKIEFKLVPSRADS